MFKPDSEGFISKYFKREKPKEKDILLSEEQKNAKQERFERDEHVLDSAKLAEDRERLAKLDKLEKDSGLNLDEMQEKLLSEIKTLETSVKKKIDDFKPDSGFEKIIHPSEEKELNNQELSESGRRAVECLKKVRGELIQHFGSQAFLDRLTIEYGGDREKAKAVQAADVENLETVDVDILPLSYIMQRSLRMNGNAGGAPMAAFYEPDPIHKVTVPIDFDMELRERNISIKTTMEDLMRHELIHAATKADVSKSAMEVLENSYKKQGFLGLIKNKEDEYYSDSSERLVRKQLLDRELKLLEIKDYEEEFTDEHFKKMLEAYEQKKFSDDAHDFIKRTLEENFKDVMNKVAENEKSSIAEQV